MLTMCSQFLWLLWLLSKRILMNKFDVDLSFVRLICKKFQINVSTVFSFKYLLCVGECLIQPISLYFRLSVANIYS